MSRGGAGWLGLSRVSGTVGWSRPGVGPPVEDTSNQVLHRSILSAVEGLRKGRETALQNDGFVGPYTQTEVVEIDVPDLDRNYDAVDYPRTSCHTLRPRNPDPCSGPLARP